MALHARWLVFLVSALVILACTSTGDAKKRQYYYQPDTCQGIEGFFLTELAGYADDVDEATKNYEIEQWKVETADASADPKTMSERFAQLQAKIYDKEILAHTQAKDDGTSSITPESCPFKRRLKRARGMLETTILTNPVVIQKEKENQDKQDALVAKNNGFRMAIPGEKEPVSRAIYHKKLSATANRKERAALYHQFQSARAKQWLEWGFKDLLHARNEEAKLAGFPTYYEYRFYRNELDLKNYVAMVAELKAKLAPKIRQRLKEMGKHFHILKVEGWDLPYLRESAAFGQINPLLEKAPAAMPLEMARRFYGGFGVSIDEYHFMMDLFPRPGKNTHAFAMAIVLPHVDESLRVMPEPKPDIRFLANLKQPVKWEDVSTVIHELGHAVHAGEVRQPVGLFRGIGSVETEAIAMTMERMAGSEEFLKATLPEFTGVTAAKLAPLLRKQLQASRTEQAFVLLRQAFFSDFEYEMYKNPEQDLAALWAKMHKEWWGVDVVPAEADWDVEHFLMAPVYIENYAIGILMVEQLYDSLLKEFHTSYRSTALGEKLKKVYFSPGEEYDYLSLTQQFSGEPLSAAAALRLID